MKIQLAGTVNDSIVDGPGMRYTVFTQGCPHHCPGCHNPQTHDPAGGREADVADLVREMSRNVLLAGLTLSGGEPFAQPEACAELARAARGRGLNVWAYSGYTWEELLGGPPAVQELLALIDVLVDGPFVLSEKSLDVPWRGSRNQRLIDVQASLAADQAVDWRG